MPELPEVQSVCDSLRRRIVGRRVVAVTLGRHNVVTGDRSPHALLHGAMLGNVARHGKQLALLTDKDVAPVVCVHLGMSGSLRYYEPAGQIVQTPANRRQPPETPDSAHERHVHVTWQLDDGGCLRFRDPRRFGGIWTFRSYGELVESRWSKLGPDALTITPAALYERFSETSRNIKAVLLDQAVLAGMGNIYVDELLFACRVHPLTCANRLTAKQTRSLVTAMRRLLEKAIGQGGSTLRDYVNGEGAAGRFQSTHRVYGRADQPCHRCRTALMYITAAGRGTTFCPACQPSG